MTRAVTVIKIGGSFAGCSMLRAWLQAIERAGHPVVVVPGGGPFADTVRAAQPAMRLDDATAHDMALLAMAQFGRALECLGERFVLSDTINAIEAALLASRIPVWSPWPMLRGHPDIPMSWDVTSDSLALWLARALDARRVVLVKHRAPAATVDELVDAAFPRFRAAFAGTVRIVGPDDPSGTLDAHG